MLKYKSLRPIYLCVSIKKLTTGKMSNNADSETSVRRPVKLELSYKKLEVVLSPLCKSSFSGFAYMNGKGLKRHCHPPLVEIAEDLQEQKYFSYLVLGCEAVRTYNRRMCKIRSMDDEIQHSSRCIQEATTRSNIAEQVGKGLDPTRCRRDHNKDGQN